MASSPILVRFAEFELDLLTGELRRNGALLKLQPQPARILSILVSRVGEVVMRQDLAREVWGSETFVDFEQGLNFAIRQIRTVLDDDPNTPKFLETLPKRGYRLIGEVQACRCRTGVTRSRRDFGAPFGTSGARGAARELSSSLRSRPGGRSHDRCADWIGLGATALDGLCQR